MKENHHPSRRMSGPVLLLGKMIITDQTQLMRLHLSVDLTGGQRYANVMAFACH